MIHGAVSTQPQFLRKSYKILLLSNLYSQAPDFVVLYDWKALLFYQGCERMKDRRIWVIIGCILVVGIAITSYTSSVVKKSHRNRKYRFFLRHG